MNVCSALFNCMVAACAAAVVIKPNSGLSNATEYTCTIVDKFGNHFTQTRTTDGSGHFNLDLTAFPNGMFTPYSGSFQLSFKDISGTPKPLTFCNTIYTGLSMSFYSLDGIIPDQSIQCNS